MLLINAAPGFFFLFPPFATTEGFPTVFLVVAFVPNQRSAPFAYCRWCPFVRDLPTLLKIRPPFVPRCRAGFFFPPKKGPPFSRRWAQLEIDLPTNIDLMNRRWLFLLGRGHRDPFSKNVTDFLAPLAS